MSVLDGGGASSKLKLRICVQESLGFTMVKPSSKRAVCAKAAAVLGLTCAAADDKCGCDASGVVLTNVSISESQTFGFDSELRALMFAADAERENRLAALYEYELHIFPRIVHTLYNTRTGFCDIGWGPFTTFPRRESCEACAGTDTMSMTQVDAFTAPPSTAKLDCCLDFAQPYITAGMSLVYTADTTDVLRGTILGPTLVNALAYLLVMLVAIAHIMWLVERTDNRTEFPHGYFEGILHSLWWSVVTVTTVGYGDHVPRTVFGRIVSCVYMLACVTLIYPTLTGIIASELTKHSLVTGKQTMSDFDGSRVCTTPAYLDTLLSTHMIVSTQLTINDCFRELNQGRVDALFYDKPILDYTLKTLNATLSPVAGLVAGLLSTPMVSVLKLSPAFPDDQNSENRSSTHIKQQGDMHEHYKTELLRRQTSETAIQALVTKWFPDTIVQEDASIINDSSYSWNSLLSLISFAVFLVLVGICNAVGANVLDYLPHMMLHTHCCSKLSLKEREQEKKDHHAVWLSHNPSINSIGRDMGELHVRTKAMEGRQTSMEASISSMQDSLQAQTDLLSQLLGAQQVQSPQAEPAHGTHPPSPRARASPLRRPLKERTATSPPRKP